VQNIPPGAKGRKALWNPIMVGLLPETQGHLPYFRESKGSFPEDSRHGGSRGHCPLAAGGIFCHLSPLSSAPPLP